MRHVGHSPARARGPLACLAMIGLAATLPSTATAQGWSSYGRDPQHSSQGSTASVIPGQIIWSAKVDLTPQYSGGVLYTHYGSIMITRLNTVLVPVKTGAESGFRIEAHQGSNGNLIWSANSDWAVPPNANWIPPFGCTLTPKDRTVVMPASGGTVMTRTFPDSAGVAFTRTAFYGTASYVASPSQFDNAVFICTPITSDAVGNLYFGYVSTLAGLPSGLARISSAGVGSYVAASTLVGAANSMAYNCAPALSADGTTVYTTVVNGGTGYLCAVNSSTLALKRSVELLDPRYASTNYPAVVSSQSTASPMVGTDGDVYYGVLEYNITSHNARGWLLHFDGTLATLKTPGSFGWDDTPSVVPKALVSSYTGSSPYLLLTKYNNYAGIGTGDGQNKIALLDPNAAVADPFTSSNPPMVMNAVQTVVGPLHNNGVSGPVYEWCINAAAIDPINKCAVINSEDGYVYRWDFNAANPLSAGLQLAAPTGEAYTSTVIGPDGSVYATNNAKVFCCGPAPLKTTGPPGVATPVSPVRPVFDAIGTSKPKAPAKAKRTSKP